jgi:hypothetical protein
MGTMSQEDMSARAAFGLSGVRRVRVHRVSGWLLTAYTVLEELAAGRGILTGLDPGEGQVNLGIAA